jgi:phage shock protein A
LRDGLERVEAEARAAEATLAETSDRLADSSVYADPERVRDLIERHNAARDRSEQLAAEWTRLSGELEAAESEDALAESPR